MRRLALALLVSAVALALDDVRLQWKFEKGATWRMRSAVTMEMIQTIHQGEIPPQEKK